MFFEDRSTDRNRNGNSGRWDYDQRPSGSSSHGGGQYGGNNNNNYNSNGNSSRTDRDERKRLRKSRWGGDESEKVYIPGMPTIIPSNLDKKQEAIYLCKFSLLISQYYYNLLWLLQYKFKSKH